jgi:hypothetical protein
VSSFSTIKTKLKVLKSIGLKTKGDTHLSLDKKVGFSSADGILIRVTALAEGIREWADFI